MKTSLIQLDKKYRKKPASKAQGYGYVQPLNIDIVENMANTQYPDIVGHMIGFFKQAIGVYKKRLKDCKLSVNLSITHKFW